MFFVAIGLIILLISFLIAVVSLIREFGQKGGDDEIFPYDYQGLELADEVVQASPIADAAPQMPEEINLASSTDQDLAGDESESLEETVPFPWETEGNSSNYVQTLPIRKEETNTFDLGPTFKVSRDNLYGEVSIQDLKRKD